MNIQVVKPEPGEITESVNIIENGDDDELHSQVNLNIIIITIKEIRTNIKNINQG